MLTFSSHDPAHYIFIVCCVSLQAFSLLLAFAVDVLQVLGAHTLHRPANRSMMVLVGARKKEYRSCKKAVGADAKKQWGRGNTCSYFFEKTVVCFFLVAFSLGDALAFLALCFSAGWK